MIALLAGLFAAFTSRDFPLGVYWPGEDLFGSGGRVTDWDYAKRCLRDLHAHHVDAVWTTHLTAPDAAQLARLARGEGVALVYSPGRLDFHEPTVSDKPLDWFRKAIDAEIEEWGDAPRPLAWGVGDEPNASAKLSSVVELWRERLDAAGHRDEPLTTVDVARQISGHSAMRLGALTNDSYPFFGPESPNGPSTADASARLFVKNADDLVRLAGDRMWPWTMAQAAQETIGPYDVDAVTGYLLLRPGAQINLAYPDARQVAWQAYAAAACGARGVFFYYYRTRHAPSADAAAPAAGAYSRAFRVATNIGHPGGLARNDGVSTPEYDALARAYARLAGWRTILAGLRPDPMATSAIRSVRLAGASSPPGALVRVLRGADKGLYLVVVAPFDRAGPLSLDLGVARTLKDLDSGVESASSAPIALAAGEGRMFRIVR